MLRQRYITLDSGDRASLSLDFTTGSLDSRITFSRPSLATMYDSTGKLTYAPNNLLTQSNTFSNAAWLKITCTLASGVLDPFGGTSAWTVTATAPSSYFNSYAVAGGAAKFIGSIYVRRRTGTGTVRLQNPDGTQADITLTTSWQRFNSSATGPAGGVAYIQILIVTSGDEIDVYGAQLEAVTYQTTPSTYVATTASAYYGPRFDYNPSTLAARGLLIEEARTNICTYSQQFANAAWGGKAYVTDNFATAPDGTTTAAKINNTGVVDNVAQIISVTAGTAYTFSFFAKNNGGTTASYRVYNITGSADIVAVTSYFSQINSSTWTRISVSFTAPVGCTQVAVYVSATNGSTENILVWGAQLEAGSFATSYIPTGSSSVARSADSVSMTGSNFSSWYNQSEGTIVIAGDTAAAGTFRRPFEISDGTSNNRYMSNYWTAQQNFYVAAGGVVQANIASGTFTSNVLSRIATAYKTNDFAISVDGGAVATDTAGSLPTVDRISLGYASTTSTEYINGHIQTFAYYRTRLSNTRLQALTA